MRRTRLIPVLLVFLLSACNKTMIDEPSPAGNAGEVEISLSADERVEIVSAKSGTDESVPAADDFWIEIFNSKETRVFREKYSDIPNGRLTINPGQYRLLAKHGDSLGVGFAKPFYMADLDFEVKEQERTGVKAKAILSNVKVAVEYGDQIKADYDGFYTVITNVGHKGKSLKFEAAETRPGYMPGGDLMVQVYAEVDGELKRFTLKDDNGEPMLIKCNPNDFITFYVNTGISYGGLYFGIKIDNGTELVEKSISVPADILDNVNPTIRLSSFDDDGNYFVTDGIKPDADDVSFTYKVYSGNVKKCELAIDCDYLESIGVPSVIDFATLDESALEALLDKGLFWAEYMNVGVVDIAEFLPAIAAASHYTGPDNVIGTFTLTVQDTEGGSISQTARIRIKPDVSAQISLNDYDIWATKVVSPVVTMRGGNLQSAVVQSSLDGVNWSDFRPMTSNPFDMGTVTGLTPDTQYSLRVMYDGWLPVSEVLTFTTEDDAQVGNASFEDWTSHVYETNYDDITWYQPWTTDQWWDTNTTVTLRTGLTVGYLYFKSFGCVQYSVDAHSGSRSAQLTCVNVGNENSEWGTNGAWRVGELFIGRGDEAKELNTFNRVSDGHSFPSRPTSMTFWYEYAPYTSSDAFSAEITIKAEDGTVLATSYSTGSAKSQWTSMTLPLNYTVTNKKAASVHITFKSSVSSSHDCEVHGFMDFSQDGPYLEIAGETKTGDNHQIKLSATLRIDDVQLNY